MGNTIIIVGISIVLIGLAYKFGLLGWFGNLPGDIKYKGENTSVFIPITSMILISIVASLLIRLFGQ